MDRHDPWRPRMHGHVVLDTPGNTDIWGANAHILLGAAHRCLMGRGLWVPSDLTYRVFGDWSRDIFLHRAIRRGTCMISTWTLRNNSVVTVVHKISSEHY